MRYRFILRQDNLKVELFNRQTVEDQREFLTALVAYIGKHWRSRILIHIHASRPMFRMDEYGLLECLKALTMKLSCKIALLGDTEELWLSHQYIELLGRQQGINLRCFWDEVAALVWLRTDSDMGQDFQVAS